MYKNKTITVIIPTYNEENAIGEVIKEIPDFVDEILVVDSSSDKTPEIAAGLGARVVREPRRGYGRAYKTGLEQAKSELITTVDGDRTYPVAAIAPMIDFLFNNKLDFVSGSRFPLREKGTMKIFNTIGNKGISWLGSLLFARKISDLLSGMWLLKKSIIPTLELVSDNWNFSEEIKLSVVRHPGLKFAEYYINYRPRLGDTKMPAMKTGWENILFIFQLRLGFAKGRT